MKLIRHRAAAVLAAAASIVTAGSVVAAFPGVAHAATTPPWENPGNPTLFDHNDVGGLIFYNAAGQQITGGSVNDVPIAAYVQGTTILDPSDTKATLYGYLPVSGSNAGAFGGEQLTGSTTYPVASPANLHNSSLPVVTGGSVDETIAELEQDFRNLDTSTTDGYGFVYQLRLKSSNPNNTSTYDAADIQVSSYDATPGSTATWQVIYPSVTATATTTVLTASPASQAQLGAPVTLTAAVSSATAGEPVQFEYVTSSGTFLLGAPQTTDSSGHATLTTSNLPVGTETLKAVFAGDLSFSGSIGTVSGYQVTPASTTTVLTASPASPQNFGTSVTLTATVTSSSNPVTDGLVQFFDGTTALGSGSVTLGASGTATLQTSALPVGTDALKAVFTDTNDTHFQTSTGNLSYVVNGIATSTVLTASPASPQQSGTPVTLTAAITPSNAAGTVQFKVGSTSIGSPVTVSAGVAHTSTSGLPVGTDSLSAVFTPTNSDYSSSTGTASYTVTALATATSLTTSPASPQPSGTSVTLTATVTPSSQAGTVQFKVGSTDIGSPVTVSSGVARTSTSALPVGTDALSAVFTPTSSNYASSTGSATFTITTPTSTSLTASPASPEQFGTSVTLTATISPTAAGTVQFKLGSTILGSPVTVSAGTASFTSSTLPIGTDSLSAVFTPADATSFAGSTGTATFVVTGAITTTVLTASPSSPQNYGTPLTLTATVTSSSNPVSDGQVQFFNGTTSLGAAVTLGASGIATLQTSALPAGVDALKAVFTDTTDNHFETSTGNLAYEIDGIATTTALSASPASPQVYGTSVALTATVTPSNQSGTVQFKVGSTNIGGPVTVSSGVAHASTSTLPVGTDALSAAFTPTSPNYSGSTGTGNYTVMTAPTSTSLSASPASPQPGGTAVTLTATVTPSNQSGTVQFKVGSTNIGSAVAVSAGVAHTSTSALPVGTDSLSAVFTPTSSNYAGSTGSATFTITTPTTTILTVSPASPQQFGTAVTLIATVAPTAAGSVQFEIGSAPFGGPVTVSAGTATLTSSTLSVGTDSLHAVFTPADLTSFGRSSGSATFVITAIPTSTVLTVSPSSPQNYGTPLTLTATVTPTASGSVQFKVGSTNLGAPIPLSSGQAVYTTTTLPPGTNTLEAVFVSSPGQGFATSSSDAQYSIVGNSHTGKGYWLMGADGEVFPFGNAGNDGSVNGLHLAKPLVGSASTPDGKGYWLVASDGGVFTFGDAAFFGSTGADHLNKPVVGVASTPDGKGYWLVASDGGVFTFGDAPFFGSTGADHLNKPVVGVASTPDGKGYWLVASDGGVFTFGDAAFFGSTGADHLNKPVVGVASTPDGKGYWLVASDGGVFAFGDAAFFGSTGADHLNKPVVGVASTPDGKGYWLVASDGGLFAFGDAGYFGSAAGTKLDQPIVGIAGS